MVRARLAGPRLTTREREPLVLCRAELDVASLPEDDVAAVLDRHYDGEGGDDESGHRWIEHVAIAAGDVVVRAHLSLHRGRLVVETSSEPRMDRVLAVLGRELPDAPVVSDERKPVTPETIERERERGGGLPSLHDAGPEQLPPEVQAALDAQIASMEERWCDEEVPALGGRTPRECAADPVLRERVVRLIDSFEAVDVPAGAGGFRPWRLRELLGLDPRP